jgi:hypothetical protein
MVSFFHRGVAIRGIPYRTRFVDATEYVRGEFHFVAGDGFLRLFSVMSLRQSLDWGFIVVSFAFTVDMLD